MYGGGKRKLGWVEGEEEPRTGERTRTHSRAPAGATLRENDVIARHVNRQPGRTEIQKLCRFSVFLHQPVSCTFVCVLVH